MNLDEVAKRAGVSTATVSRVLNNLDIVRPATRQRVMKAVEELNYHPNLNARTLAGGKSNTIGMIVSNLENPFFLDIFHALESEAHQQGYDVLIANTAYQPAQLTRSVQLMIGRRVAGLAVIVSEMDPGLIDLLEANKIPAVFYDVGRTGRAMFNIRVNYKRGIEKIVNHLHSLGHRRLAFVSHHSALGPTSERETALFQAVQRLGKGVELRAVANQDGLEGGRAAARELFDSRFDPTAIICVNDVMAIGVLREARTRGLRVPGNVSVTGFDNIQLTEFTTPALTTVHIARDRIGAMVFKLLVEEAGAAPEANGREVIVEPELVIRESTGPRS